MGLLDSLLGGGGRSGGMSKIGLALLALLAYRAYRGKGGKGETGGLGDILGRLGGGNAPDLNPNSHAGPQGDTLSDLLSGRLGGLAGGLGGLLGGGAAGGLLIGGLNDLLKQFQDRDKGDVAESWIGKGANKKISAGELEAALGEEQVNSLAEQAGLSRMELIQGLSEQLPNFIDRLTPDGRIPTEEEAQRML